MASGVYKVTAGGDVILTAPFITRTPDPTLGNEFALDSIADGILKHTAGTPATATAGTDYVLPTGVAGGQTIVGGTAASNKLILRGTSHATPGNVEVHSTSTFVATNGNITNLFTSAVEGVVSFLGSFGDDVDFYFEGDASPSVGGNVTFRTDRSLTLKNEQFTGNLIVDYDNIEFYSNTAPTGLAININSNATSGTRSGYAFLAATFNPTSGTAAFRPLNLSYTINQTGGANGTVTGIFANATETAVGGTHNLMDLQVGGVSRMSVANSGHVTAVNQLLSGDGSAATPALRWSTDTDTGLYRSGANDLGIAVGGADKIRVGTDITLSGVLRLNSTSGYEILFQNAQTANIYQGAANQALFLNTNGGELRLGTSDGGANLSITTTGATVATTFNVGASNQFSVGSTGNITKINNVTTSFPAVQGGASTVLTNDGAGNLTWNVGAAATGVLARFAFTAPTLLFPLTADWTVNAFADGANDTLNDLIGVARYDDTTEEGRGMQIYIPATAANLLVRVVGRAQTAPGGAANIQMRLYTRQRADNAATGAWSSAFEMNVKAIPTNTNWQYFEQTISLAALGLTAGRVTTLELTRRTSGVTDNLTGDFTVSDVVVEVTT